MTPFRIVVSWLVLLLLASQATDFCLHAFRELRVGGWKWGDFFTSSGLSVGKILLWSPLWFMIAVLIAAPWIQKGIIWWRRPAQNAGALEQGKGEVLNKIGRWSFSAFCIGAVFGWLPEYLPYFLVWNPASAYNGDFSILLFLGCGLLAAACIAPELAVLVSSGIGFTGFIDAVFFPGGREAKPPYTLKLARFYVEKARWAEAEAEYARMLVFYPHELDAWQERLRVAFVRTDREGPEPVDVLAEALKAMPQANHQAKLHACFEKAGRIGNNTQIR